MNLPAAQSTFAIRLTLEGGSNDIRAVARDLAGNEASTGACDITLVNVAVAFNPPVSDGILGRNDGTVNGSSELELLVCGTVSDSSASMTVTVDGGQAQTWSPGSTAWCTPGVVALAEGQRTILAEATGANGFGSRNQVVTVDLTAPGVPADLTATAPLRNAIDMFWTEPADLDLASYEIRYHTAQFSNDTTGFESEGTSVGMPPAAGTTSFTVEPLWAAVDYYVGIQAVDTAGNRSPAALFDIQGVASQVAVTPEFDQTGPILAPVNKDGDARALGFQVVSGNFDNDDYADLAVSAPLEGAGFNGNVYI